MLGWKKHKLESRLPGEISITSDMQRTPPLGHSEGGQIQVRKLFSEESMINSILLIISQISEN